jgi:hypothetical protein
MSASAIYGLNIKKVIYRKKRQGLVKCVKLVPLFYSSISFTN